MTPLNTQKGAALLAITVVLLLTMSVFMYASYSQLKYQRQERLDTQYYARMQEARTALIAYALTKQQNEKKNVNPAEPVIYDRIRLGELPCPDASGDGSGSNIGNGCASLFGWLPWRTLGMSSPQDKRRIWYAVDANFHNQAGRTSTTEPVINPDTEPSGLTLDGKKMAAILIAEGAPVTGQPKQFHTRPQSSDKTKASQVALMNQERQHFLEGRNASQNNVIAFVSGAPSTTFNDYAIGLTSKTLMTWVGKRVLHEYKHLFYTIAEQYGYLPFPADARDEPCGEVKQNALPWRHPIIPSWGRHGYIPKSCSPTYMRSNTALPVFDRAVLEASTSPHSWLFRNQWPSYFKYTWGLDNYSPPGLGGIESLMRYKYYLFLKLRIDNHSGWYGTKVGYYDSQEKKDVLYIGRRYKVGP